MGNFLSLRYGTSSIFLQQKHRLFKVFFLKSLRRRRTTVFLKILEG